jgi:hypothetical protein
MRLFVIILVIFSAINLNAQDVKLGIKGGMNYNFSGDLHDIVLSESYTAENKVGYHGGLILQFDFQDLFLRTEGVYTQYETDYGLYTVSSEKVDVPILLGTKFIGPIYLFAGPDFQYIMEEDFSMQNTDVAYDDFTIGLNVGIGLDLGKLDLELKWDKALSGDESHILESQEIFSYDTRPNQLVFSLTYCLTSK